MNNQNLNEILKLHKGLFIKQTCKIALLLFSTSLYVPLMFFGYAEFRNALIWLQLKFSHVNSKHHLMVRSNYSPLTASWDRWWMTTVIIYQLDKKCSNCDEDFEWDVKKYYEYFPLNLCKNIQEFSSLLRENSRHRSVLLFVLPFQYIWHKPKYKILENCIYW